MIPLRDTIPHEHPPVVNTILIGVNVVAFFFELALGHGVEGFIHAWGFVPARFFASFPAIFHVGFGPLFLSSVSVLTSMFLHGGWMHIAGNMLFLYIFGDNVEDRFGHVGYLGFYLASGILAASFQAVLSPGSMVPMIGASGAISGVMGAYMVMFPHSRVLTLVPIFFFLELVEIPAYIYLGIWFVLQFFQGTASLAMAGANRGGVAFFAHIGGFLAGWLIARWWKNRRKRVQVIQRGGPSWPFDF